MSNVGMGLIVFLIFNLMSLGESLFSFIFDMYLYFIFIWYLPSGLTAHSQLELHLQLLYSKSHISQNSLLDQYL